MESKEKLSKFEEGKKLFEIVNSPYIRTEAFEKFGFQRDRDGKRIAPQMFEYCKFKPKDKD